MLWPLVRVREGARWLLRGSSFTKLEADIERMAAPLAHNALHPKGEARMKRRIKHALSWLPADRAEKYHDLMDRVGHSVRN